MEQQDQQIPPSEEQTKGENTQENVSLGDSVEGQGNMPAEEVAPPTDTAAAEVSNMPSETAEAESPSPTVPIKKSKAPLFIILGIVVVIIAGAAIFLLTKFSSETPAVPEEPVVGLEPVESPSALPPVVEEDSQITNLKEQGTSTEVSDIEMDLENTDIENIDAELKGLEDLL